MYNQAVFVGDIDLSRSETMKLSQVDTSFSSVIKFDGFQCVKLILAPLNLRVTMKDISTASGGIRLMSSLSFSDG